MNTISNVTSDISKPCSKNCLKVAISSHGGISNWPSLQNLTQNEAGSIPEGGAIIPDNSNISDEISTISTSDILKLGWVVLEKRFAKVAISSQSHIAKLQDWKKQILAKLPTICLQSTRLPCSPGVTRGWSLWIHSVWICRLGVLHSILFLLNLLEAAQIRTHSIALEIKWISLLDLFIDYLCRNQRQSHRNQVFDERSMFRSHKNPVHEDSSISPTDLCNNWHGDQYNCEKNHCCD